MNKASVLIIIVDDEDQIVNVLTIMLKSNNYQVETAFTGQDGLTRASANPDLILLDLGLPDRSGDEILTELRKMVFQPDHYFIRPEQRRQWRYDFTMKPFRTNDLLSRIKASIEQADGTKI